MAHDREAEDGGVSPGGANIYHSLEVISNNGFSVRCAMTTRRYHSISSRPGDSPLLLAPQTPLLSFILLTHTSFLLSPPTQPLTTSLPQRNLPIPLSSNATSHYLSPSTQPLYNYLPQRTFHTSLFSNVTCHNSYLNLGALPLLRLFTAYSYFMQMVRMKMFIKF